MKKKKVLISLSLILMITLSSIALASETEFTDVKNSHWGYDSIYWGVQNEVITGYEDNTFKPDEQITEQEFTAVLARFVKDTDKSKFVKKAGVHWSQAYYDELARFQIPLKGYNNMVAKDTAPTRGDIARVVAAKNGFNLTERQAIYYMYENELSLGTSSTELSFKSYSADKPTTRAHTVAFFQRLEKEGKTTFMGKQSPAKGDDIVGIVGVPQDKTEITDKDFDDLAKDKGITNPGTSTEEGSVDSVTDYSNGTIRVLEKYLKDNGYTTYHSDNGSTNEIDTGRSGGISLAVKDYYTEIYIHGGPNYEKELKLAKDIFAELGYGHIDIDTPMKKYRTTGERTFDIGTTRLAFGNGRPDGSISILIADLSGVNK